MAYTPRLKQKIPGGDRSCTDESNSVIKTSCRFLGSKRSAVNQGLGTAIADKKLIDTGIEEMTMITGQRAVATKSKKDISNFKLRKGYADWRQGYPPRRTDV